MEISPEELMDVFSSSLNKKESVEYNNPSFSRRRKKRETIREQRILFLHSVDDASLFKKGEKIAAKEKEKLKNPIPGR